MDIEKELLKEHSKLNTQRICNYIGNNEARFSELMKLFLGETYRITQRAAWVVRYCADQFPELIMPYEKELWENLSKPIHVAVKRNTLAIYQDLSISKSTQGIAVDVCFEALTSVKEPIAVKVFAMSVLFNIVKEEPDLGNELKMVIEDQMPHSSAGFKSRGKRILKKLDKMIVSN